MKCGTLFWARMGKIIKCGKPAVAYFDRGSTSGHPVCRECKKHVHKSRLSGLPNTGLQPTPTRMPVDES
jgi:hypothetical protein